jgi:lipopolysaccharide assembly outer membrane protein LptD (OstA)
MTDYSKSVPCTSRTPRRPTARRKLRFYLLILFVYTLAVAGMDVSRFSTVAPTGAQPRSAADTAGTAGTYDVTAGNFIIKEIGGVMTWELSNGVKIIHGDVTVVSRRGLHYVDIGHSFLYGDVEINQGTMTMWGDEGEYRKLEDLAIMRRNVRIVDEGWEVTCDEASYSRTDGLAWLVGNIVAKDSSSTMYADSLFYDRDAAFTEAFGNVRITNPDEGFAAEGEHGFYYRNTGEGVIDRYPHLIVDPESPDPVTIDSDTMRVYPERKHAIAYYTVKILKGNTVTQCDSAVLYDEENRAELYGKPLAKQDRVHMSGQMMALHYDEEEVHRIDINGAAEIVEEQSDTLVIGRDNWMQGDTMALYLHENRVDSIRVLHNAVSEYFPTAPNKTESNFVRGDSMFFRFEADSLAYVRIIDRADGVYKYINLTREQTTDSLRAVADTNLTYVPFQDKAEKVVYAAKNIEYFAVTKDLVLRDDATITYQNRTLTGDVITYLSALQLLDTRGDPKLVDGGQEFFGRRMVYDLDAEAGLVNDGSTRFEQGYYNGENVAKVGENEMKVWHSKYTTCDLKVPHYHIKAKHMKVYHKDKAISGSTILYIGETPIFYLPFIANSIRRGRRSGILRPDFEFGINKQTGRYIRNIGYFWATNDYTDFKFVFDFNEDSRIKLNLRNRYKVRYKFDGGVNVEYLRDLTNFSNRWVIDARHNHTLGEKFSLRSNMKFVSDDEALKDVYNIDDVADVVDRNIRSTLTVSKTWGGVGLTFSALRTQILNVTDPNTVKISMTLPSVKLSIPQRDLFFGERHRASEQGIWEKLLRGVKYSPGLSGDRKTTEKEFVYNEVISSRQSLAFNSPQKVGFINLSPKINFSNSFTRTVFDTTAYQLNDTTLVEENRTTETDNEFRWGFGAGASTNFFGTFYPRIGRLRGIRHKVSPRVSYQFNPKIGDRPRTQSFSVGLENSFDLKMVRKKKVEEKTERGPGAGAPGGNRFESGVDAAGGGPGEQNGEEDLEKLSGILIWTLSTRYNPEAPKDEGWGNISSAVNLRMFNTSISMNQSFEPYKQWLLNTDVQTAFTIRGSHPFGRSEAVKVQELNVVAAADTAAADTAGAAQDDDDSTYDRLDREDRGPGGPGALALEEGRLPWSLRFGFGYSKRRGQDFTATVNMNGDFNLTKNWKFVYSATYDIAARDLQRQYFSVHRDLHCWEMSLGRRELVDDWEFYFKISIKAHPEIYGETGNRGLGAFAGGITSGGSFY